MINNLNTSDTFDITILDRLKTDIEKNYLDDESAYNYLHALPINQDYIYELVQILNQKLNTAEVINYQLFTNKQVQEENLTLGKTSNFETPGRDNKQQKVINYQLSITNEIPEENSNSETPGNDNEQQKNNKENFDRFITKIESLIQSIWQDHGPDDVIFKDRQAAKIYNQKLINIYNNIKTDFKLEVYLAHKLLQINKSQENNPIEDADNFDKKFYDILLNSNVTIEEINAISSTYELNFIDEDMSLIGE